MRPVCVPVKSQRDTLPEWSRVVDSFLVKRIFFSGTGLIAIKVKTEIRVAGLAELGFHASRKKSYGARVGSTTGYAQIATKVALGSDCFMHTVIGRRGSGGPASEDR